MLREKTAIYNFIYMKFLEKANQWLLGQLILRCEVWCCQAHTHKTRQGQGQDQGLTDLTGRDTVNASGLGSLSLTWAVDPKVPALYDSCPTGQKG